MSLKKKTTEFPSQVAKKNIAAIEDQMDRLLGIPLNPAHKEAVALQKRLLKYRGSILTFLHYHKVPPDNNGSERAVRNIKVKQKTCLPEGRSQDSLSPQKEPMTSA
jgi:hypothetical protein